MRQALPHAWLLAEAIEWLQGAGRLQRQFFQLGRSGDLPLWEPPVDMFGNEQAICLLIALPGVAAERMDVRLEQQAVVVRGERSLAGHFAAGTILQLEIPYGRFERRVPLPYDDYRVADMVLQDGCLRLTLERMS
ncbi:Hsp20/alpha crystallin family protein [Rhodoferax sp.]|uniref:Hsp20/alpha crystallin family protein n=1 Tax=Rhodoferax sp. TaxID=50421 RepID=UPI0025D3A26B|nr:Hsp20/alpha crystallin family protein [Rhodoferax sp.]MCM2341176.1 Hsp20/alpha crystallin family protein [Rhodoferax sp.]